MTRNDWIILCLAYIIGLLSTNLIPDTTLGITLPQLFWLIAGLIGLALIYQIALGRKIKTQTWITGVIVAIIAVWYFQLRIPQPQINDISYQVTTTKSELVTVSGKVLTEPRLNDSQRLKFQLKVTGINEQEAVSGKLYSTLPLLQGTGIYPGQQLQIKGFLYLPQAANNPGGFDFKQYLARQGIFAGIQGIEAIKEHQTTATTEPKWGWWKLRRRIVRSQLKGLGSPVGQLVSSMVLGRKAVDLSHEIRDRFIKAGLAHILAASGFHVSLLLGIILKLAERFAAKPRLGIGITTLIIYLGLTGIQASVLRACLMGIAVLIALAMERKVKPLGSLLLVATIILLFNPLLIRDLGFQLSFLATLGLIVTLPGLQSKLDWLPPTIATLVAVPLAATIWVLPLLCYVFNTVATYSILVNIICTPLITVISLGGMISAIFALILPVLGSAIAWLLLYPTLLLIALTKFFTNLPGNTWAIGQISLGVLLTIYGLLILARLNQWWQKRWWLTFLLAFSLLIIPAIYHKNQLKIAVLSARESQIIIIQDRGQTALINSGSNNQAKYTVLPFLAQQGINQIHYGFALDDNSNSAAAWYKIDESTKIKHFASLIDDIPGLTTHRTINSKVNNKIMTKSTRITLDKPLGIINLQLKNQTWLMISSSSPTDDNSSDKEIKQYIQKHHLELQDPVIIWSGNNLDPTWIELLQPKIAIASSNKINFKTEKILRQKQIKFHNTAQEGMIRWNPQDRFITQTRLFD